MSLKSSGVRETPSDLTRILKKVRAALEDRRSVSPGKGEAAVSPRENGHDDEAAGHLEDVKEAFGACQTIEWKEQEYRYLRSKVIGHRRRDVVSRPHPKMLLGGSTLPPIHRCLLRSVSTPDAPQLEKLNYRSLRHRRTSLGHESEESESGGGGGGTKDSSRRRRSGATMVKDNIALESEPEFVEDDPSQICAKIVSYVKSNAWTSRESLLSAASRSLDSSDEDSSSVILNPSDADSGSVVLRGLHRSVSEETLIYRYESPIESKYEPDIEKRTPDHGCRKEEPYTRTSDTETRIFYPGSRAAADDTEIIRTEATSTGETDDGIGDIRTRSCVGGHPLGQNCLSCPKPRLTEDPGGTAARMASFFDSIPHIDSSEDEDEDVSKEAFTTSETDPSVPQGSFNNLEDDTSLPKEPLSEPPVDDHCTSQGSFSEQDTKHCSDSSHKVEINPSTSQEPHSKQEADASICEDIPESHDKQESQFLPALPPLCQPEDSGGDDSNTSSPPTSLTGKLLLLPSS
ncbi:hypothetical protein Pmani_029585 [Petrolisthes manimaculis]|uniref:Uncharacterized protein n=1 Tax=Petrolisthes manimaculis TaxID=1843537 RepID=A0AAE1TUB0_9EUCA|nr:hypothetical protein Pmani_029585 [Petrolisthes manimaculis]